MAYETYGRQIVEDSVATVRDGGDTTVNGFTKKVQEDVRRKTEVLQKQLGGAAKDIVGDALAQAESYAAAKNRVLDPNFQVKDAAKIGAAAYAEMGSRKITVDKSALDVEADEGYWERTKQHELVHVEDQTADYNRTEVSYVGEGGEMKTVDVIGTMTEGQATQENEAGDLTPEYRGHQRDWREMAAAVGEGAMTDAMKTGDMQGLQDRIIEDVVNRRFEDEDDERVPPPVADIADEYEGEQLVVDEDDEGKTVITPKGGAEAAYERAGVTETAPLAA